MTRVGMRQVLSFFNISGIICFHFTHNKGDFSRSLCSQTLLAPGSKSLHTVQFIFSSGLQGFALDQVANKKGKING